MQSIGRFTCIGDMCGICFGMFHATCIFRMHTIYNGKMHGICIVAKSTAPASALARCMASA